MDPGHVLLDYCQVCPSPNLRKPATALAKVWSQLIFNMSVTPVRETITIGKWRASLRPPDAPLDQLSASLRCARLLRTASYVRQRPGSPLPCVLSVVSWTAGARHQPPLLPPIVTGATNAGVLSPVGGRALPRPPTVDQLIFSLPAAAPPSSDWSHPGRRTPPPAPHSP